MPDLLAQMPNCPRCHALNPNDRPTVLIDNDMQPCTNTWHDVATARFARDDVGECRWTFYDRHLAYPLNHMDVGISDELVISYSGADCDEGGEFMIRWHDITSPPSPKIEVFSDDWEAFSHSALPALMARFAGQDPSIAELRVELTAAGYHDKTQELREQGTPTAGRCIACNGTGRQGGR